MMLCEDDFHILESPLFCIILFINLPANIISLQTFLAVMVHMGQRNERFYLSVIVLKG